MGRDRIELRGIRVTGTHGALDEERRRPQPFEVDLDIEADLSVPGRSDDLLDTVDYGTVAEVVAEEIAGRHADLLEHLAQRIADRVLDLAGARAGAVSVTVRKLRPPVALDMASAGVRVHRVRPAADDPDGPGSPAPLT